MTVPGPRAHTEDVLVVVCGPCYVGRHDDCHWSIGCECICPEFDVILRHPS